MNTETRLIKVRENVLKQNDVAARALRQRFREAGVYVVSLVSSPGTGKTTFLESSLGRLRGRHRVAALVGDLATDNDARRLARAQVPIRQITTGTVCHLEAEMVQKAARRVEARRAGFSFCRERRQSRFAPRPMTLGEGGFRLVLLSVTEGEDKPLKYPPIFNSADVAVITKVDLAAAVEFDRAEAHRSIQCVRPGMQVFEVSAKTGQGMDEWLSFLESRLAESRQDRVARV